ncbi:hypothetical protein HAZT_HAZT009919, partial [Hyalella azteca]
MDDRNVANVHSEDSQDASDFHWTDTEDTVDTQWQDAETSFPWTNTGLSTSSMMATASSENSILRATQTSYSTTKKFGASCTTHLDCPLARSECIEGICSCQEGSSWSQDLQLCEENAPGHEAATENPCSRSPCHEGATCVPQPKGSFTCDCPPHRSGPLCGEHHSAPYQTPSFQGNSFLEIKKIKAYNKVQIELEFRSFTSSGLLLYTQQQEDGEGDFLSLAVVVAKRYQRDGVLQLDGAEDVSGKAPGHLKSLDLRGSTFLGYVKGDSS